MVTIDQLVDMVAGIADKPLKKRHIDGPTGVRGRNSDNRLIREKLDWSPSTVLVDGLRPTYAWISRQVMRNARSDREASVSGCIEANQHPCVRDRRSADFSSLEQDAMHDAEATRLHLRLAPAGFRRGGSVCGSVRAPMGERRLGCDAGRIDQRAIESAEPAEPVE